MNLPFDALPFDSGAMLDGLRAWVECESPTFDPAAVNRMMDLVTRDLIVAGARTERVRAAWVSGIACGRRFRIRIAANPVFWLWAISTPSIPSGHWPKIRSGVTGLAPGGLVFWT